MVRGAKQLCYCKAQSAVCGIPPRSFAAFPPRSPHPPPPPPPPPFLSLEKITVDELVAEITPRGRATVPEKIKNDLLQDIRKFLQST